MTLHLPAETALALALALNDPHCDLAHKRTVTADAIQDLINFLDDTEGDPDLEENGDEWDSAWPEGRVAAFGMALHEDSEDSDAGEDDGCSEPSLGAPEIRADWLAPGGSHGWHRVTGNQERWAQGNVKDLEENVEDEGEATNEDGGDILDEPHDELDEGNDEYSLGGVEPDGPSGWTPWQNHRAVAAPLVARARRLRSGGDAPRRDPDELTRLRPGVAQLGGSR